uniref:Ig-like domain-containing protein n=1 Tax=Gasterosteus aculeatus aculeatus TaxID=481459 RepID=A0AAQ4QG01_GASAC
SRSSPSPVGFRATDGHGYFMYADFWCNMQTARPQQVEYLVDWYFNKEFTMQYNSTVGKWTGFTAAGLVSAAVFNGNHFDEQIIKSNEHCIICTDVFSPLAAPAPSVRLAEASGSGHNTTLVCSAYDFYPRRIRLAWLRDGQEVTSGATFSEVTTNGNWTYAVHSSLSFTPGGRDRVSCKVEHAGLQEPALRTWAAHGARDWETGFLVGGVCALLLGAACLSSVK